MSTASTINHLNHQAAGKIGIALQRLADRYPFHAKIVERFKVQPDLGIDTMGVTVAGDDVLLLYNADFVLGITLPMLTGVLLHEVHHVLFGHILANPADYPDGDALTTAEEVTVNEFVKEPLPDGAITLSAVAGLPPMESTDQRYSRLAGKAKLSKMPPITNPKPDGGQVGSAEAGSLGPSATTQGANGGHGEEGGNNAGAASQDRTGKTSPRPARKSKKSGELSWAIAGNTVDDHSIWQEARGQQERSAEAIRAVVEGAVLEMGPQGVPPDLADAVAALGFGDILGTDEQHVSTNSTGSVTWHQALRRYVGRLMESQPVFNRPPRRFPELVGVIPGRRRGGAKPKVMAVIDTSGSITPDLLDDINTELATLAKNYQVTVVECDAEIHGVYKYRALGAVQGRGGTDFRPVFKPAFLRRHRPDLVIYFTDGLGPAPDRKPPMPVIWCLVAEGERPAEWGRVIRLDAQK